MNLLSDLGLPLFDFSAPDFSVDPYQQRQAMTGHQGWLAKSPLAYIVLDRDSSGFFLWSRATAFPAGRSRRSSARPSPDWGPGADVT